MDDIRFSSNPAITGEKENEDDMLPFDDAASSGEPTYSQICDRVISMVAEGLGWSQETMKGAIEQTAMAYYEHPVSKLNEHCMARRLEAPCYDYARSVDDVIGPGWTVRCTVVLGSNTVVRDGVSTTKKEAKKIAAKGVYDVITGRQDHSVTTQNSTGEPVHPGEQSSSDVPCTATPMIVDDPMTCSDSPSQPGEITSSPPVYLTQNRRTEIVNEIIDSSLHSSCSTNETTSATVQGLKRPIADSDTDFPKPLTKKQKRNKKVNARRKLKKKMLRASSETQNNV